MSAIKTHEMFHIVAADDINFENEDGEHCFHIKSMMVSRQQPSICQLFAEKENTGSLVRETKVSNAKIEQINPETNVTQFSVKAKIGDEFRKLNLKTVRSENSECCIC